MEISIQQTSDLSDLSASFANLEFGRVPNLSRGSGIRVLRLLPIHKVAFVDKERNEIESSDESIVELETQIVNLSVSGRPSAKYEALSYTWGTSPANRVVRLNGRNITARPNLVKALEHLRLRNKSRHLWIDAICINQADEQEKSHQVRMMRRIYTGAQKTIIWLGPREDGSVEVLPRLETQGALCQSIMEEHSISFAYLRDANDSNPQRPGRVRTLVADFETALTSVGFSSDTWLPPIKELLSHPYWDRAWIRQELTVSKRPVIHDGLCTVQWDDFASGLMLLVLVADTRARSDALHLTRPHFTNRRDTTEFLQLAKTHVLPLIDFRDRYRLAAGKMPFKDVLRDLNIAGGMKATYPQDYIFSILGLAYDMTRDAEALIDYTHSAQQVFREATTAVIHRCWQDSSSHALHILNYNDPDKGLPGLPSWVPDWSSRLDRTINGQDESDIYNADCSISPAKLPLSLAQILGLKPHAELVLPLLGVHFDSIFEVGASFDETQQKAECGEDLVRLWMRKAMQLFQLKKSGEFKTVAEMEALRHSLIEQPTTSFPYRPPESTSHYQAMARTLILDRCVDPSAPPGFYHTLTPFNESRVRAGYLEFDMFCTFMDLEPLPDGSLRRDGGYQQRDFWDIVRPYHDFVKQSARGRRPAVSETGRMALVPHSARPGDELVVLFGAPVPFVLRRTGDGYHQLLAGCYVHGAMDGEMIPHPPFSAQRFDLR